MVHTIGLTDSAIKQLTRLPKKARARVAKKIDHLKAEPLPRGHEKLQGEDDLYRVRSGQYRVIYRFQTTVVEILVIRVGNRRDVYRNL